MLQSASEPVGGGPPDLAKIVAMKLNEISFLTSRNFSGAATPVQGTKPTRALVTTGIYGWSRNPIYLGMFLFYIGIGLVVRSPWILILTLPLAVVMRYVIVAREEAYLERRFADAYPDYKGRVRRWL